MSAKRIAATDLATATLPQTEAVLPSATNALPLVLGGRPIQQLPLPHGFVVRHEDCPVGPHKVVGPSDLADVRAKFKAGRP